MQLALILRIAMTFVPILVRLAEKLFGDGTGEEKRKFVLKELPHVTNAVGGVVTGGAKETWDGINDNIDVFGDAIDAAAGLIFPNTDDQVH